MDQSERYVQVPEANDYKESVLLFNMVPTEGAVYIYLGLKASN